MTATVLALTLMAIVWIGGPVLLRRLDGPPPPRHMWLCRCGHPWDGHRHFTRSTHCGLCGCAHFQPPPRRRRPTRDEESEALAVVRPGCGCGWRSGVFLPCDDHAPKPTRRDWAMVTEWLEAGQ